MSNQASEDALEQHLLNDKAFQHILKFAPESQRELMTFELARYIDAIIRTEKLKLLAEVRERVQVNQKGQFEEDSTGTVCWYLDDLVEALKELEAEL